MKKYFEILRCCPLFLGFSEAELLAVSDCLGATVSSYERGETVFAAGEKAEQVGIVLHGAVRIERVDYYGARSVIGTVGAGELFGESFACAGVLLPIDAVAATDTAILAVDCRRLLTSCTNACDFHRRLIYNLMQILAAKNLVFHRKLEITSKRTTREKLLAYLLSEAERQRNASFTIPFDRQTLADYLAVDRSGLSAEIGKLVKEGILETRKNEFTLLKNTMS
jgi:CRP-like cAMP-binding protein